MSRQTDSGGALRVKFHIKALHRKIAHNIVKEAREEREKKGYVYVTISDGWKELLFIYNCEYFFFSAGDFR